MIYRWGAEPKLHTKPYFRHFLVCECLILALWFEEEVSHISQARREQEWFRRILSRWHGQLSGLGAVFLVLEYHHCYSFIHSSKLGAGIAALASQCVRTRLEQDGTYALVLRGTLP